jgi:hypothetical protein
MLTFLICVIRHCCKRQERFIFHVMLYKTNNYSIYKSTLCYLLEMLDPFALSETCLIDREK